MKAKKTKSLNLKRKKTSKKIKTRVNQRTSKTQKKMMMKYLTPSSNQWAMRKINKAKTIIKMIMMILKNRKMKINSLRMIRRRMTINKLKKLQSKMTSPRKMTTRSLMKISRKRR